jgi:hypothetical protein
VRAGHHAVYARGVPADAGDGAGDAAGAVGPLRTVATAWPFCALPNTTVDEVCRQRQLAGRWMEWRQRCALLPLAGGGTPRRHCGSVRPAVRACGRSIRSQ